MITFGEGGVDQDDFNDDILQNAEKIKQGIIAVSYTHLTLPTICSV